jgi:uncharacterized protein YcfJ
MKMTECFPEKSFLTQAWLAFSCLGLSLASGLTQAGESIDYVYANVVDSQPMYETEYINEPQQHCWQEERQVRQPQSHTGTILGGIVGAAVGNELGHGHSNKNVGAVAGALLGASIGRDVSSRNGSRYAYRQVEHCEQVNRRREKSYITGYRVTYRYQGELYSTQMARDPGPRIKLRVAVSPVDDD